MSLNNLALSSQLIADLYPTSLIEQVPSSSKKETLKFLGKNQKNILILVSKDNAVFLEDSELNFLTSVLTACKLSLADIAIVNLSSLERPDYLNIKKQLNSRIVLLFDVE